MKAADFLDATDVQETPRIRAEDFLDSEEAKSPAETPQPASRALTLKPGEQFFYEQPAIAGGTPSPPEARPEPFQMKQSLLQGAAEFPQKLVEAAAEKLPKPLQKPFRAAETIPIAIDKTLIGIADWAATPKGATQLVAAGIPATRIPVAMKFFYDMAKGGGEGASAAIDAWNNGDTQGFADAVVGTIASLGGAALLGAGVAKSVLPKTTIKPTEVSNGSTGVRGYQGQPGEAGQVPQGGENIGRENLQQPSPEQPQPVVARKEAPETVKPPSLTPVLEIAGKPVAGESHAAIRDAELARAKTPEERDAVNEAFIDQSKHKFQDQNGNILSRDEAKPVLAQITGKPVTKPVESSDIPKANKEPAVTPAPAQGSANVIDWDLFGEDLVSDLDSFSPARNTGKIDYELMDVAERFIQYAKKSDQTKSPLDLFKSFKDIDESSRSQLTKLRQSIKSITTPKNKVAVQSGQPPEPSPVPPTGGELETGAASTTPPVIEKISTTKGKGQVKPIESPIRENGARTSLVLKDGTALVGGRIHPETYQFALDNGIATKEQLESSVSGFTKPDGTTWDLQGKPIQVKKVVDLSEASAGRKALAVGSEAERPNVTSRIRPPPAKAEEGARETAILQKFPDPLNTSEMNMTSDKRIRSHQKTVLKAMYADYKAPRHDAFVERYNYQLGEARRIMYERNRGITEPPMSGPGSPSKAQGPEQTLGSSKQVKVIVPEGATQIRVTDKSGKVSVQPLSNVNKGDNPFQGVDIKKVEAGIIGKNKKFQPVKGPISVGPGAQTIGEPAKPQITQLTDSIRGMAQSSTRTDSVTKVFDLGRVASEAKDRVSEGISGLKAAGEYLKTKLQGYPVWNSWKAALGDRHLALTESVANAKAFVKESERAIPDSTTQAAISKWIDMGGNDELLAKGEAETKPQYKAAYAAARNLTPEQLTVANNAKNYFDSRLQDAIDNGILEDGIEDYIHRYYQKDSPFKQSILNELRSGIFTGRPAFAKQRVNQFDLDAEKAGLKPVQSFIKRIAAYDLSLNKAIADRQAVKAMTQIIMPDGRPLADVAGIGVKVEGEGKGATLIKPSVKKADVENPVNNRADYKSRDYPALRKWKWVSQDASGNPILVQGDVVIHPDGLKLVDPLFRRSAVRQNPVGRLALGLSSTIKQTMLDLSGFHPVQITVHGWEHRTFKPVEKIDFDNPDVRGLIRGGLVAGETTGHELFSEGLTGSSLTRHIPVIGDKLQTYNHWLFNDYIPRLKVATGLHALERNRSRFKNLSDDELYHLTANQMNNAFGELNYDMIGRSKTTQDVMRLALLAPDFLEARAGFAGQALTKYGREQFAALALGAVTLYVTSRIINKLLSGEYHFEPKNAFSVVYNKRAYSLRTVQGDILHAITDPGKFIYNRLNPTFGRTLMEFFSKRDVFGRQRSGLQQLKDFATTIVPISLRGLINPREQTLWESFLNAIGITERRSTQQSTVYQLAENFRKANNIQTEPGEFIYDPDKDPYRSIKEAAVFSTVEQTAKEINKAVKAGHSKSDIWKHFVSYSQRPFTGSRKNDALFYEQLSDDNKKIYDDALNERKQAVEKFRAAWELATEETPSELPTTQGFETRPKFNVFSE